MLPRFLIRKTFVALRLSANVVAYSKHIPYTSSRNAVYAVKSIIPHRHYSAQTAGNDLIVDYEYVKDAISNNNILIVDVREPDEIKEHGKIPNSINIPLGDVTMVLSTLPETEFLKSYKRPKPTENTQMIFYCMSGRRSGMAQQNAINAGFKNVKNYLGSWTDWSTNSKS